MALTPEPGFTIESVGVAPPPPPVLGSGFATIMILAALVVRPYADPQRSDFSLYLQARSFAHVRADIPVPAGATIPAGVVLRDGRYYAQAAPGTSLLLVPFVWAGGLLDELTDGRLGRQDAGGWHVSNAEYAAVHAANLLFLAGILFFLDRLGAVLLVDRSVGVVLRGAELSFFAAPLWSECSHPVSFLPATMFLLGATAMVFQGRSERAPWLAAGALAGAAIVVRPTDLVLALLLLAYGLGVARRPLAAALRFAGTLACGVVLLLAVDVAMHGASLDTSAWGGSTDEAASTHFETPLAEGLLGLTVGAISAHAPEEGDERRTMVIPDASTPWKRVRGLVLVMPVVLFGIAGLLRLDREDQRAEAAVVGGSVLLLLLLFARSSLWFGDSATPLASRFLTEAMPAWCLATAAWAEEAKGLRRSLFMLTTCWSACNQLLVVLSPYLTALSGVDVTAEHAWKVGSMLLIASVFAWLAEGTRRTYEERSPTRFP